MLVHPGQQQRRRGQRPTIMSPLRTTAFPQLYTEGMVYDFGNKTLVDPNTLEVVPSNNLLLTNIPNHNISSSLAHRLAACLR
jgi:hypothetical protein